MPVIRRRACSTCGRAIDPDSTCERCGTPHGKARRATYASRTWRRISAEVIARDGCCQVCGSTEDLTAHHRRYPALSSADAACLCRSCNGREGALRQGGHVT